jgi:hypothetical protein
VNNYSNQRARDLERSEQQREEQQHEINRLKKDERTLYERIGTMLIVTTDATEI